MAEGGDVPPLEDICTEQDDEDSDGWDEMETTSEQTTCLFCAKQFLTIAVALDHCRAEHNFDLLSLKKKYHMDCYSYIKMINYIRLQKPDPKILTESDVALWDDDVYLKTGAMEPWLMYDFDDLGTAPSTPHYAIDGKLPMSNINFSDLQLHIQDLSLKLKHKDALLDIANKDLDKMKKLIRTLVDQEDSAISKRPLNASSLPAAADGDYFNSYSHFGIHHDMLNDKVRTESYRDAILKNSDSFKDKVVLDVGCGTGILSMFSAKAGASQVIGIDQSEVIYKAMGIIRENNLHEQIHLIKGKLETLTLPVDKVDIIVSEWMGYFLLFEGMLDSFIYARDKFLKPGGLLLPNRCNISVVGCSDSVRYDNIINFWDDVYGFSMQCMKTDVLQEAFVETVPKEKIFTNSVVVTDINLMTCNANACEFASSFVPTADRDGDLTAIVGYFDTFFELPEKVEFSTGPHVTRTHWQQTVFYLKETVALKQGQSISCKLTCTRFKKHVRGISVTLVVGTNTYQYLLD